MTQGASNVKSLVIGKMNAQQTNKTEEPHKRGTIPETRADQEAQAETEETVETIEAGETAVKTGKHPIKCNPETMTVICKN